MSITYSELITLPTFLERFEYVKLHGVVGEDTFGCHRYLNQVLYRTPEWKKFRQAVILRDNGFDLGAKDHPIGGKVIVHHLNPLTKEDILYRDPKVFDMENAISVSMMTHNAIHYGDEDLLITDPIERTKNDTCPWR